MGETRASHEPCNVPMVKRVGWSNEMEFGIAAQITISPGVLDVSDLQAKT